MDLEFKKTSKNSLGRLGLYTLLLLCITALGIGSYSVMRRAQGEGETETAIDWDNQGGTVDADKRETKITVERTTLAAADESVTTQRTDNLPFTGSFALPLGTEILKDYSDGEMVSSKTMGDWRVHNGIDFTGSSNAEVFAMQDGTVKNVYEDALWGTVVEMDHGNTMLAKYCGLKSGTTVRKGDTVKKGATIGKLGEIPVEAADGGHLHLEITVNGTVVDPLAAMNRAD